MRLFIAANISDATRSQLRRVREGLQRRLEKSRRPPRVTWVADQAAHITIRFIGEEPEDVAERLRNALHMPIEVAPFAVEFKGAGTFPGGRSPRVVWIGITQGLEELARVAATINARVDPIVGPAESRPFRAHLTVGRVKEPGAGFDWAEALATIRPGTTRSHIDHVSLFHSRTSSQGPTYTELARSTFR